MTRQEALAHGFVYEGKIGVVPVYLTELNAFGHKMPGAVGKNLALDIALAVQTAIHDGAVWLIELVKPGSCREVGIWFGSRLDGAPVTDEELA